MKRIAIALLAGCLMGCAQVGIITGPVSEPPVETASGGWENSDAASTLYFTGSSKPANKFCAVNKGEEVDPSVTTVYKGKIIGFCCESCIDEFKKAPEKFMKDLK